jgi:hypothetical protein
MEDVIGPSTCDTCGNPIPDASAGMLQWLRFGQPIEANKKLSIVHNKSASPRTVGCYLNSELWPGSLLGDWPLNYIVSEDEFVLLLAKVADNKFSFEEIAPILMRLFVPNYERARHYFDQASGEDIVDQGMPPGYFLQDDLRRIIENIPHYSGEL